VLAREAEGLDAEGGADFFQWPVLPVVHVGKEEGVDGAGALPPARPARSLRCRV
jgi:hypothetical protein